MWGELWGGRASQASRTEQGPGLLPPMPHLQCGPHPDFQLEMSSCQRIRLSAKLLVIGWSVNSK